MTANSYSVIQLVTARSNITVAGCTAVVIVALMALNSPVHASDAQALPVQDAATLGKTCTEIVGAAKGTTLYDGCVSSLSQTARSQRQAAMLARNADDCSRTGLRSGTASFATCILQRRDTHVATHAGQRAVASVSISSVPAGLLHKPFIESTPAIRQRKEEYACAQLGLSPDGEAFGQCVADLGAALDPLLQPLG